MTDVSAVNEKNYNQQMYAHWMAQNPGSKITFELWEKCSFIRFVLSADPGKTIQNGIGLCSECFAIMEDKKFEIHAMEKHNV